jgi:hypothetical protein
MIDLAVAANFVRELTEEQFAEPRRRPRRAAAANGSAEPGRRPAANRSAEPAAPASQQRERKPSRMRRTLGRLAQVRG